MNSDATEAALGLLGLSPLNAQQSHSHPHPQPHPHHHVSHTHGPSLTSTSVGIAVDRTSTPHIVQSALPPSLVPLKRKQPSPSLSLPTTAPLSPSISRDGLSPKPRQPSHPLATSSTPPPSTKSPTAPPERHPQQRPFSPIVSISVPSPTPLTSQLPLASPSTSQSPLALSDVPPPDSDAISCICGFTYDDGFSIACDDCSRWCHAACFGIVQGEVPEFWKCWVCDPAVEVDKERAIKIQKGRLKAVRVKASHGTNGAGPGATSLNGVGGSLVVDEGSGGVGKPVSRRKTSPGAERKSRRGSAVAAAIEGSGSSKKKRPQPHAGSSRISHSNGSATFGGQPPIPVTFPPDIYPNPSVYSQLLRVAKAWRGVTALNPPSPLIHPPPKTYNDGGYTRVESQGYRDRYGYSMSPLDNATPVILDENAGEVYVPPTVLRTDPATFCSKLHSTVHPQSTTCTPAHLRPPSPKLHVASGPSPFSYTSVYPSPPISNHMSPPVPSSSHSRPYVKSPLTPSTNTISSSNPNIAIPATTLLAPYTASITPSAAYLADPLNGYAHLGMGKPQVRLVGGGWEVGLDARSAGGIPDSSDSGEKGNASKEDVGDSKARWARCGCWPNAVVRPVICDAKKRAKDKKRMRHKAECAKAVPDGGDVAKDGGTPPTVNGRCVPPSMSRLQGQQTDDSSDQDDTPSASDSDADNTTLSFALFALRDLRADEEIVLGWEWDDGHAVHMLPALMESPGMFAPGHLHHLRAQFTSILHALSSTFTTCACGASTRDCAVRLMESVVEGRWPWPGAEMTSEGSEDDYSDVEGISGECGNGGGGVDVEGDGHLDSRPKTNWGLGVNMDLDVDVEMDTSAEVDRRTRRVKKRKVRKKSKVDDAMPVDGGKNVSVAVSASTSEPPKPIDLGPLVGVKRGFRTREKVPMNGGWGGVEIVPSSLEPFPDVDKVEADPRVGSKGKGKAQAVGDEDDMDVDASLSTLPPRMRKVWPQSPAHESMQENPGDHSQRTESWRAHERWRSPPKTTAESPVSVSGAVEGSGRGGGTQGSPSGDGDDGTDGQETESDTETEVDGLDDTRQMPPPPMPASLDPTTVSSLAHAHAARSLSPRSSIGIAAARIPSRTPTPTSAPSGRSSQPPSQGTAAPDPPNLSTTSSLPANSSALPLLTPFPAPKQTQIQTHSSSPLASSVSPSATFSRLSLHSPDASSSPHTSVLFDSHEPNPPFAPAPTQRNTDLPAPSPPPHRPPKPLHVHPQNESPLPASLSVPIVTLDSPDAMRDTPAEAQYQQSYRSSPESQHETDPPQDVDKKRPADGEVYRVRFASPEILCGLPRPRGRASSDGMDSIGADDVPAKSVASEAANDEEVRPSSHDAMDVDLDVTGDGQMEDGSAASHTEVSETTADHGPHDASLPQVLGSPHFQVPSEILPHSDLAVVDGVLPENDSSPPVADVDESTSQAEPMAVDPEPTERARESSPPPPPKVKMSLKDFALRRRKQREEEIAAKSHHSPATPDGPALPSSPSLDVQQDLVNEHSSVVNGHEVMVNGAAKEDAVDSSGNEHDGIRTEEMAPPEAHESSIEKTRTPPVIAARKVADAKQSFTRHRSRSPSTSARAVSEWKNTDQTQTLTDNKPLTTLSAKMEIVDAMLPSGPTGTGDRTPDAGGSAPEPPPPPLATKQTSEATAMDRTVPANSVPKSIAPSTPSSTPTPASISTSTPTSAANSRSNSVGIPASASSANPPTHLHVRASSSSVSSSRRPSHEDGEITSSTPPKTYVPRSHTPPTQPRSFHAPHPPSPNLGPTSSSTMPIPRRPIPPLSRSSLSNAPGPTPPPTSSRPLPSGPRALRGSMTQPTHTPPYPPRPPYSGSQYIPRGPSADRDRLDWDRGDRPWAAQARSRSRAGSNGWGR